MILKTTRHGLLASLREDADWDALVTEVRQLRARGLQTADDTAITFDLGWREITVAQFDQLIQALTVQGLQCLGILSTSHQTRTVAEGRGYRAIIGRLGLAKHQGRKLRQAALAAAQPAPAPPPPPPETQPASAEPKSEAAVPLQPTEPAAEPARTEGAEASPTASDTVSDTVSSTAPVAAPAVTREPGTGESPAAAIEPSIEPSIETPIAPQTAPPSEPEQPESAASQSAPSYGDEEPTLYLRRTLRSGQRVVFGGNVVLLGDLNPGAQIEADGDVIVLGQLRGSVHAGCEGDRDATVVATSLQATQLRIADSFFQRASERTLFKRTSVASAVRARLEGDQIILEPLPAKQ